MACNIVVMRKNKVDVAVVRELARLRKLLHEILVHQVANLGHPEHEFYSCYTYRPGKMPPWVAKAKAMLRNP